MFGLNLLEIIYILTSIMSTAMLLIYFEEILNQIDKSFVKLKEERENLVSKVQTLEKQLDELKSCQQQICNEEEDTGLLPYGKSTSGGINEILKAENRKLNVRCDMLEEELRKMREQGQTKNEIENKYSFRIFNDKKTI